MVVSLDWPAMFARGAWSPRSVALRIAASFAALGFVWMITSDVVLYMVSENPVIIARIESAMDWAFVLIASALLYIFALRAASRLSRTRSVLSAVVRSIGDGVLVIGPDKKIVHANPSALRILGCHEASDLLGMDAQTFSRRFLVTFPDGAVVKPDAFMAQRAFEEEGALHYKAVLHRSENEELVVLATAAAVRSRPGEKASLVVSVVHDITDSENLERLRDRFFQATAHALKTPIAIIKANVQFIAWSTPASARPSFLAIERQCDRIDRLVQNLQIIARARSHSLELHLHELELAPLVLETARELASMRSALDVRAEIASSPRIFGDRERLALVVRNLSYEAYHAAMPHTPVTLRVEQHDARVELRATFEPLPVSERTFAGYSEYDDDSLSRSATATVVEAHGGEVGALNGDEEATLWVRLPIMEKSDERLALHPDRR
jgi:PAS domain S-box-containing protein